MTQNKEALLELYNEGLTLDAVGQTIGISRQAVYHAICKLPNYKPRDRTRTAKKHYCPTCGVQIPRHRKYCKPSCQSTGKHNKLTLEQVKEIYLIYQTDPDATLKGLGLQFKVSATLIGGIVNGQYYKYVTQELK